MTDLQNGIDPVTMFFPSEVMLEALLEEPAEVRRLVAENHALFWRYFDEIDAAARKANPGYSCWATIFSELPYYMFQSDFCGMVGPDMFAEFILPELAECFRRIPRTFYHLDGPGQLKHLDAILAFPELRGVQWIPGAGQPDERNWPEVFRKIRTAGKLVQVFGNIATLDAIAGQLGSAKGICLIGWEDAAYEGPLREGLARYGVPAE
jgi:hypothetical protein